MISAAQARPLRVAGALLCLLAAWLYVPKPDPEGLPTRPGLEVAVVDVSASAMGPRPDWTFWVRDQLARVAQDAEAAGRELMVVEFARSPGVIYGPAPPDGWKQRLQGQGGAMYQPGAGQLLDPAGGWGSELSQALALVEPELLASGRDRGRLTLLSDGSGSGPSPAGALARLAAAGIDLVRPQAPPHQAVDLAVMELHPPRGARAGVPLRFGLELALDPAPPVEPPEQSSSIVLAVEWELRRFGEATALVRQRRPLAEPRPNPQDGLDPESVRLATSRQLRWDVELQLDALEEGLYELDVRALRAAADRPDRPLDWLPENDRARTLFAVGDRPRVALATPRDRQHRREAEAFARRHAQALEVLPCYPEDVARLAPLVDALFTVDVPVANLPVLATNLLLQRGGGWLCCTGWDFLIDWLSLAADPPALGDGRLDRALPLLPVAGSAQQRDVILLADGSGSMQGEPFERVREAVRRLALGARASDRVQLRFFSAVLGGISFQSQGGTRADKEARLAALMQRKKPGGQTDLPHVLDQLSKERLAPALLGQGRPALCILLTDGHTSGKRTGMGTLRRILAASGCDLRILAASSQPDRGFLRSLLLPGEELIEVGNLSRLVEVLSREVNRDLVRRGDQQALVFVDPSELPRDSFPRQLVESPWRRQVEAEMAGPLPVFARAQLRPDAFALARSQDGAPVAAFAWNGAAPVVQIAAAPWGSLAVPALKAEEAWLVELLLALSAGADPAPEAPRLSLEGRSMWMRGAGSGTGSWRAELRGPQGELVELELLPPPIAAVAGSYRGGPVAALVDRPAGEPWQFRLESESGEVQEGTWTTPLPRELVGADWFLGDLPRTGDRPPPERSPSPWSPAVLLLGLLLLFASGLFSGR